jgi:hypothetical protein
VPFLAAQLRSSVAANSKTGLRQVRLSTSLINSRTNLQRSALVLDQCLEERLAPERRAFAWQELEGLA